MVRLAERDGCDRRAGLSLSAPIPPGELKDPSRAIPLGTITAVAYTLFIYILLFFLSSFTCDRYVVWDVTDSRRGWVLEQDGNPGSP